MYKSPENFNRVKAIKDKFEDNCRQCKTVNNKGVKDSNSAVHGKLVKENLTENELTQHPLFNLSRQLSDPGKKNVKRTPAFRLDSQPIDEKDAKLIKNRSRYLDKKNNTEEKLIEPVNKKVINNKESIESQTCQNIILLSDIKKSCNRVEAVDKFIGQLNFMPSSLNRTKEFLDDNESKIEKPDCSKLKALYTEPIPRHLRPDKSGAQFNGNNDSSILENTLLNISNSLYREYQDFKENKSTENIINNKNCCGKERSRAIDDTLTDTLKSALKRPLPYGPAPKKPPRTFIHLHKDCDLQNNLEDLQKQDVNSPSGRQKNRNDPVYMLEKLEKALKSNNCLKKQTTKSPHTHNMHNVVAVKTVDFKNKNDNNLKTNLLANSTCRQSFNLNCLNSLGCTTVEESSFVSYDKEKPLYAEPFEFRRCTSDGKIKNLKKKKQQEKTLQAKSLFNVRDSVHYASYPIPDTSPNKLNCEDLSMKLTQLDLATDEKRNADTCDATPVSSSSCTSDLESTISSISEESETLCQLKKVKDIISVFETSPKCIPKGIKITSRNQKKNSELKFNLYKMNNFSQVLENDQNHNNGYSQSQSSRNKRESVAQITKKFEVYVKRVRSKVYAKPSIQKDTFKHLFDCFLLVGLNGNIPYIKSKYPENVEIPYKIEELCFPDAQLESMDLSEAAQCYSLVITNANGERTYGYCRRVLPEGSSTCLPLVYCIVSRHCAPGFYKKILQELESRHGFSEKFKNNLLNELYNSRFPKPGEMIKISIQRTVTCSDRGKSNHPLDLNFCTAVDRLGEYATVTKVVGENEKRINNNDAESNKGNLPKSCSSPNLIFDESSDCSPLELILFRHSDTRHEENNLQMLCNSLPLGILHQVFSSLLLERKVVIVSKVLSKISACVEALQIALYPFVWPHTLIPVLPQCLWEILEAPTPLLCGVLSKQVIDLYKIENGMVVDLDEGSILLKVGDEDKILRWTLFDIWKDGLSLAKSVPSHQSAHNVLLSDAFLRVFIKSCGHYKQHIVNGEFQKTCFIESGKVRGRGIHSFLTWFSETTMFYTFIESVLKNQNIFHVFDQRIEIYSSEATGGILKKMKENSKEKSSFFRFS